MFTERHIFRYSDTTLGSKYNSISCCNPFESNRLNTKIINEKHFLPKNVLQGVAAIQLPVAFIPFGIQSVLISDKGNPRDNKLLITRAIVS